MKTKANLQFLRIVLLVCFLSAPTIFIEAQNIVITDSSAYEAKTSAVLDVQSSAKGLLVPRLTTVQRLSIMSPDSALLVYDKNFKGFFYFNGTEWMSLPKARNNGTGEALFQIVNSSGDTVFAVYEDGVEITVPQQTKGTVGGFAISGRSTSKGIKGDIFKVTSDETRVYVSDTAKGVGGFAISGRSTTKQTSEDYLFVTPTRTQVYVNEPAKGTVGGFAVSGRSTSKGINDIIVSDTDSTRIFISDNAKGSVGGFAVSGRSTSKSGTRFLDLTPDNYFIGHLSGSNVTSGLYNSFYGYETGVMDTSGSYNVFMGYQSGYSNLDGRGNVFIGYQSGYSNLGYDLPYFAGSNNVFIGHKSGYSNTHGLDNVFLGYESGASNISGDYNVFLGHMTGNLNISGENNVYIGYNTGMYDTTGADNVYIGSYAGSRAEEGSTFKNLRNVAIGSYAGYNLNGTIASTFVGYDAGRYTTTGSGNTFFGMASGKENITGRYNTFLGTSSGEQGTATLYNTFVGESSGRRIKGNYNTFVGSAAGVSMSSGYGNCYIGKNAGKNRTNGSYNVIIGLSLFTSDTLNAGDHNVFVGAKAGESNFGEKNIFIGYKAGYNESESSRLYIESSDADSTDALIYGQFDNDWLRINDSLGIGRNPITNQLEVEGEASKTTAGSWLANSDRRIKTDIMDIDNALELVDKLHPVKFRYTKEWQSRHPSVKNQYYYNFIAQEYQEVFPESVQGSGEFLEDEPGEILQLDSYNAQIVTVQAVKELIKKNKDLEQRLNEQEALIKEILKMNQNKEDKL